MPASTPRNPAHNAARENLLRDIRLRLRAEAARDSHSLSAAAPADIRGLIEAMVDRVPTSDSAALQISIWLGIMSPYMLGYIFEAK